MSNLLKSKFFLGVMVLTVMLGAFSVFSNTAAAADCTITSTLKVGSKGTQVVCLQKGLGLTADGSFGPKTKVGVVAWQKVKGLVADGIFGAKSRAVFVSGVVVTTPSTGCTGNFDPITGLPCSGGTTTPQTGPVTVALANDNPVAGNVISGQATADFLHVNLVGTGTVTSMVLQRSGISDSSSLTNVYLYDGVNRLTDSATINTNGVVTFNGLNIVVSGSKTIAVKADVASPKSGSTVALTLTAYTVAGGTSATVNVAGNTMTIQDGTGLMAGVVVNNNTVAASSISAGTMGYTLWSSPLTVSTRTVLLKSASFKFVGSAPASAFTNMKLYANGAQIATSTGVNAMSYVVFDLSGAPYSMITGSTTLEVRGDVVNGSYRDGKLSIENAADLMITDPQLGVNVSATGIPQGTPAGKITILQGSLISQIDTTFNALTSVTGGASNAVIARYKLTAYGEDMKVSQVIVTPVLGGTMAPAADGLDGVTLYWNGGQIGSSQNVGSGNATQALTFALGSNLIVPAGTTGGLLEVRANMKSVAEGVNYTGGVITVSGSIAIGQAQGVGSNGSSASYQTNSGAVTLSATSGLTISTAVLGISASNGYSAQTLGPNSTGQKIASFSVQNQGSSEGLRFTNLAIGLVEQDGTTALTTTPALSNFTNLRISEASGVGTVGSPTATTNFPVDFTLAPGASKTIDVFADLASDATNDFKVTLLPTLVGASSNVSLTPGSATAGQLITLGSGTFNGPSLVVSSSAVAQYVTGNSTSATKAVFTILASSGTATISELKFGITGSGVTKVTVGSVSADVISGVAILPVSITVPNGGSGATIEALVSYSPVGAGGVASATTSTIALTSVKYTMAGTTTTLNSSSVLADYLSGTLTGVDTQTIKFDTTVKLRAGMKISIKDSGNATPAIGIVASIVDGTDAVIVKSQAAGATGGGAGADDPVTFISVPGNEMTLVGSKPTLTVVDASTQLINGLVKVGSVTVAADAKGDVALNVLPLIFNSTGYVTVANVANNIVVKNAADQSTVATTNAGLTVAAGGANSDNGLVTFTGGYSITGGGSVTFDIYTTAATVANGPGANVLSMKLGAAASLTWTDVAGNGTVAARTGALINNYPTTSSVIND
ncbi:MAG: peptidoglycan-binding domain-containing protein [bacterium]